MKYHGKTFDITIETPYWDDAFCKAQATTGTPHWLSEEYITHLVNDLGIFPENAEALYRGAKEVSEDSELLLLVKTLYNILALDITAKQLMGELKIEFSPNASQSLGQRMFLVYPILGHLDSVINLMKSKNISDEMIRNTFLSFDGCITVSKKKTGVLSFIEAYFNWSILYIRGKLIRIGRLEFELVDSYTAPIRVFENNTGEIIIMADGMHCHKDGHVLGTVGCHDENGSFVAEFKESDTAYEGFAINKARATVEGTKTKLSKEDWKELFRPGDAVVGIHIPAGGSFTPDICEEAYNEARKIFRMAYPQYDFKIFKTATWLLSVDLNEVLKPTSNILAFQRYFNLYPIKNKGTAVFFFAFDTIVNSLEALDFEKLPQDTSLQRNIIDRYQNGKYIREYGGLFAF